MKGGPVEGNKENIWWLFSVFRTARGFVLVFVVLAVKNRITAYRTVRGRFAFHRRARLLLVKFSD